jgi:hypothetical protein
MVHVFNVRVHRGSLIKYVVRMGSHGLRRGIEIARVVFRSISRIAAVLSLVKL